ncbi:MAG TPA: hypothetical protein P5338_08835 [Bacteroidales bacterium]|nr:hypothetical protein [Bacteroidales bacterium]
MKKNRSFRLFGSLIFWLLLSAMNLSAQPFNGGEITWECHANGRYRFKLVLYRECAAVNLMPNMILSTNIPGLDTFTVSRISITDLSPFCSCPGIPAISCASVPLGQINSGALEMHVYTSDVVYPQGVLLPNLAPPPTGWYIALDDCCRGSSTNQNSLTSPFVLRSWMFNYNNINAIVCIDNAPVFSELPQTVVCTGYPATLNFGAIDYEVDSLAYDWAPAIQNVQGVPVTYTGYAFNNPLPGPQHNPSNIAATLNPKTGLVNFTSFTPGAFWLVVKVTAYKCGVKAAEIYREIEVVLVGCGVNNPPNVTPPFPNSSGQYTLFDTTVYAGQVVPFMISATDFEYCPNSTPPVPQTIHLFAMGNMFGAPVNPYNCVTPPCAVLTPSPAPGSPIIGQFGVQTYFNWQTCCSHLNHLVYCNPSNKEYHFLFKTIDNFCPVPAFRYTSVTIRVKERPALPSPLLKGTELLPEGDVKIKWIPVTDTLGSFLKYYVWYHEGGVIAPFTLLDSLTNVTDSEYVHLNAHHNANYLQYFVTTHSLCFNYSQPLDTVPATSLGLIQMCRQQPSPSAPRFPTPPATWQWSHTIFRNPEKFLLPSPTLAEKPFFTNPSQRHPEIISSQSISCHIHKGRISLLSTSGTKNRPQRSPGSEVSLFSRLVV